VIAPPMDDDDGHQGAFALSEAKLRKFVKTFTIW
jgi:hypothetical protein